MNYFREQPVTGLDTSRGLDGSWGGTGIYGPNEPETCDVGAAIDQAARTANYPGGHPQRDTAAEVQAVRQTWYAHMRAQDRGVQAGQQADARAQAELEPEAGG
jgi:hypothetical protein